MITETIKITGYGSGGEGIGRLKDGRVAFVRGAAVGDVLEVSLAKEQKRSVRADIVRIVESSPHRVEPQCPYFPKCGGCDFQHISYEEELRAKLLRVNDAMERIAGLKVRATEILSTTQSSGYRNKAVFHVSGTDIGFYSAGTNEIVPIKYCLLLKDDINAELKKILAGESEKLTGNVQKSSTKKTANKASSKKLSRDKASKTESPTHGITLRSGLHGLDSPLEEQLGDLTFSISGFFQVNTAATLILYEKAREYAALTKSDTLVDLYCGVGTMTIFIGRDAGRAIGVEVDRDAVKTARKNTYRNGFERFRFVCADVGLWDFSGMGERTAKKVDCVIVDPPRRGLSRSAIEKILSLSPKRIVYVSCDPATLARDIGLLRGYEATRLCAVDMFPRTANVETVSLLARVGTL